ncbi:uncharacterized protein LOC126481813 [Schistocerca serialis cubense]|uniref:uncharacterized protein LOC126481813 n=1 Tax=Schistocerca serialis cubense TaxID=2023355 RepID=UPI00214F1666|nr:uncharacterized protein LOC126481813 [Schistocerca serialis cubense]
MCHGTSWTSALPIVLLRLRVTYKPDIGALAPELVSGEILRLPGEFVDPGLLSEMDDHPQFLYKLKEHVSQIKPTKASRHGCPTTFLHNNLKSCTHITLHTDYAKPPLQPPYTGVHHVLSRVKPAYIFKEASPSLWSRAHRLTDATPRLPAPPPQHIEAEPTCTTHSG